MKKLFGNRTGNLCDYVATGSFPDYCQVRLIYNKAEQFTYRMVNNNWLLGLISESVTVTQQGTETYLYDSNARKGDTTTTDESVNIYIETAHYANPWETAYQNYRLREEEVTSWQIGTKTFYF